MCYYIPDMQITRRHNRTKEQAKEWVDRKLSEMLQQFGESISAASHHWRGDALIFTFSAAGFMRFDGTLSVTDTHIHLDLPFPLLARGFEPSAVAEVNKWLDDNLTDQIAD